MNKITLKLNKMKVFYKGKYYNSVVDGLTVNDVEENYGGFGEDDCYLPECSTYCLLDIDGGVVVPEMGYYDGDECTSGYVNLGDVDVDLSDTEILVDLLQSLGLLVGPVEMFLIDQPMECDMIVRSQERAVLCSLSSAIHLVSHDLR